MHTKSQSAVPQVCASVAEYAPINSMSSYPLSPTAGALELEHEMHRELQNSWEVRVFVHVRVVNVYASAWAASCAKTAGVIDSNSTPV